MPIGCLTAQEMPETVYGTQLVAAVFLCMTDPSVMDCISAEHADARGSPMQVLVHLEEQSPDIGQGVHGLGTKTLEEIGAGDQGHMFGYATDETEELMPLTHVLATRIGYKLTQVGPLSLEGICTTCRA